MRLDLDVCHSARESINRSREVRQAEDHLNGQTDGWTLGERKGDDSDYLFLFVGLARRLAELAVSLANAQRR